jgi:predicted SAM-dependent methyltransferase
VRDVITHPKVVNAANRPARFVRRQANARILERVTPGAKLHLGCGTNRMSGWVNIDSGRAASADVLLDLRGGLPMRARQVHLAYSEHVIEHFDRGDAQSWLRDLRTGLMDNGAVRVATPDLEHLAKAYLEDWRSQEWLSDPAFGFVARGAQMFNMAMRSWGHQYLYDEEDLRDLLRSAGFRRVDRCDYGQSSEHDLRNLERRGDSKLIMEARP